MKYSAIPLAQTIVYLCQAKGIQHIVICPGSRNAPLTIGFTENPYFKTYSLVDERVAAFFALGIAQQIKKPVAVICTSGSAVLNFYPAVAESFYSDIPLVVISADRPANFIDIGDGQTIRQPQVFANHILYSANLKEDANEQAYNESEINQALHTAILNQGPVHINAPFSEPLYLKSETPVVQPQKSKLPTPSPAPFYDLETVKNQWQQARKILILTGVLPPHLLAPKFIEQLAAHPRILVMTETTSNLSHPQFIGSIDQLIDSLSEQELADLQPDLLLTFGGLVVSKKIKAFLRKYQPQRHWHVDPHKALDTYFCLEKHFKMEVNDFFEAIFKENPPGGGNYASTWLTVKKYRLYKHQEFCNQVPYSDFLVFDQVFKALPKDYQLQLSNSATIRYSQLFELAPELEVFCNRGTSGIDGSTSTAIGAAVGSGRKTVLITGDLSFFYDSNALWNPYTPDDFKIIIINNQGGGIFRILPGERDTPNFDNFFETIHQLTAKHLAAMYSFSYTEVHNKEQLLTALPDFFSDNSGRKILEVFTPRKLNDKVLRDYFSFIA
jgi:2-succinyl-5-enolpyruvyl-6-hydroxy-3-cyclohexene-1-carboxylate synthase